MTAKQKRFCEEFVKTGNAKQSAIKAGYSEKTAKQIGQKLLTRVDLQKYMVLRQEKVPVKLRFLH